jgi:hypothetical protein
MFPNLTVIRGQKLFSDYALVIYETDLIEVSIESYVNITNKMNSFSDYTEKFDKNHERLSSHRKEFSSLSAKGDFSSLFIFFYFSRLTQLKLHLFPNQLTFLALKFRA